MRIPRTTTIALVNGTEPVAVKASGDLAQAEPLDDAWFRRKLLELMYDVGVLREEVAALKRGKAS